MGVNLTVEDVARKVEITPNNFPEGWWVCIPLPQREEWIRIYPLDRKPTQEEVAKEFIDQIATLFKEQ